MIKTIAIIVLSVAVAALGFLYWDSNNKLNKIKGTTNGKAEEDILKEINKRISEIDNLLATGKLDAITVALLNEEKTRLIALRGTICNYCCAKGGTCEGCNCGTSKQKGCYKDTTGCYVITGGQREYFDCRDRDCASIYN